MSLAVANASALVAFYATDDPRRQAVAARLATGDPRFAPAHVDAEIVSALQRLSRSNTTVRGAVPGALRHLAGFDVLT